MKKNMVELFAGVGGFRVGLERLNSGWETSWFSQWEPGKKKQWAHDCYVYHFGDVKDFAGECTTGIDISEVDKRSIPDHTLLTVDFHAKTIVLHILCHHQKELKGKKVYYGGK